MTISEKSKHAILHIRKFAFLFLSILILVACKSATDVKYNELNTKFFYMRMGYHNAVYLLNSMLDKQTDITFGRKYIHEEDNNLTPSEQEKLDAGITFVEFTPTEKEISDANILINKINKIKHLVIKTDSICKHALLIYKGSDNPKQLDIIIKHPESTYAIMDKDLNEIKSLDKELRAKMEMSLLDFLIQNNKYVASDYAKDSSFLTQLFPSLQ